MHIVGPIFWEKTLPFVFWFGFSADFAVFVLGFRGSSRPEDQVPPIPQPGKAKGSPQFLNPKKIGHRRLEADDAL